MENSNEEYLDTIHRMIRTAQRQFVDTSALYILWGCAVAFACILQYVLIRMEYEHNYIGWLILMPGAGIAQFLLMRQQRRTQRVRTHIERVLGAMWTAFGVSLGIVLFMSGRLQESTYPIVLCLYAISIFVVGSALRLRVFTVGAICCWVIAIISFFVPFDIQLILLAIAVIVAYVIPGFILRAYHNNSHQDVQ